MIKHVFISKRRLKELKRSPFYIQEKFRGWVGDVNKIGLMEVRKHPGWHDEPLQGVRRGQRSIRLNKQWRAIYVIREDNSIEFVEIIEVIPHEY